MNVDKKLLPAPKQSYNEDMFSEEDTVKLIHITTINVHQQNFTKGKMQNKILKMHFNFGKFISNLLICNGYLQMENNNKLFSTALNQVKET